MKGRSCSRSRRRTTTASWCSDPNASTAPLPAPSDNSYAEVKAALANSTEPFTEGLREKAGVQVQPGAPGPNALVIRARITKSDPGSKAARYWASFGAGAAKVGISGEIVDGGTGKVLARCTQERRSGLACLVAVTVSCWSVR